MPSPITPHNWTTKYVPEHPSSHLDPSRIDPRPQTSKPGGVRGTHIAGIMVGQNPAATTGPSLYESEDLDQQDGGLF